MTQSDPAANQAAPQLFDRALYRRRRARAAASFADFSFLRARAVEDVLERLSGINRRFECALELACPDQALAQGLAGGDQVDWLAQMDLAPVNAAKAACGFAGDEERLPIREGTADLAVSILGLHAVNDLPGALVQINRALRPDGLFIGVLYGGGTLRELRESLLQAESELTGGAGLRIAPFTDVRDGGALLQRAGFALPVADTDTVTVRYADPLSLLRDLRGMGEANILSERARGGLTRTILLRMAEIYRERFALEDGRVPATFELLTLTGWRPHESQQKPLRPGSARSRLADALGTQEISAGVKPDEG